MMHYRFLRLSTNLKVENSYKDFPNKRVVVFVIIAQILNVYVCFQVLNFSLTFSEPILDLVPLDLLLIFLNVQMYFFLWSV